MTDRTKPWSELTDEERAAHRRWCIEAARPDVDRAQVEHIVDLLGLDEFIWEESRHGRRPFSLDITRDDETPK